MLLVMGQTTQEEGEDYCLGWKFGLFLDMFSEENSILNWSSLPCWHPADTVLSLTARHSSGPTMRTMETFFSSRDKKVILFVSIQYTRSIKSLDERNSINRNTEARSAIIKSQLKNIFLLLFWEQLLPIAQLRELKVTQLCWSQCAKLGH